MTFLLGVLAIRSFFVPLDTLFFIAKAYFGILFFLIFFSELRLASEINSKYILLILCAAILIEAILINTTDIINILPNYPNDYTYAPAEPYFGDIYRRPRSFAVTVSNTGSILVALLAFVDARFSFSHFKLWEKLLVFLSVLSLCSGTTYLLFLLFIFVRNASKQALKVYAVRFSFFFILYLGASWILTEICTINELQNSPYWKISPQYIEYLSAQKFRQVFEIFSGYSTFEILFGINYWHGGYPQISGDFGLLDSLTNIGLLGTMSILYLLISHTNSSNRLAMIIVFLTLCHYSPLSTTQGHIVFAFIMSFADYGYLGEKGGKIGTLFAKLT